MTTVADKKAAAYDIIRGIERMRSTLARLTAEINQDEQKQNAEQSQGENDGTSLRHK